MIIINLLKKLLLYSMLTTQMKDVLYYKNKEDGSLSGDRIAYKKFQMSSSTIQEINKAGLQDEFDDFIEVESSFKVKKIGKFFTENSIKKFSRLRCNISGVQSLMVPKQKGRA